LAVTNAILDDIAVDVIAASMVGILIADLAKSFTTLHHR
jgi:hypothetical protein